MIRGSVFVPSVGKFFVGGVILKIDI